MINAILSNEVKCPKCQSEWMSYGVECDTCQKGIIPDRTLKFISDKMVDCGDYYQLQYFRVINITSRVDINFKIMKQDLSVFELNYCSTFNMDFPGNTVKIADKMISEFSEGKYLLESKISELVY